MTKVELFFVVVYKMRKREREREKEREKDRLTVRQKERERERILAFMAYHSLDLELFSCCLL